MLKTPLVLMDSVHSQMMHSLFSVFLFLTLPPQNPTADREKRRVDGTPSEEHPEIQPDPRMKVEKDRPRRLDDCENVNSRNRWGEKRL